MKSINLIYVLLAVWASSPAAAQYVYEADQALIDLQNNYIATSYNFNVGDDQVSSMHDLGFTFDFYGEAFTQARMATNGCLHFKSSGAYCNDYTPDPLTGQHTFTMYPFWTDLIRDNDSKMLARNFSDKTVFGWYNMREYNRASDNSFEVILWQNDSFEFRYGALDVINHDVLIGETGESKAEAYTYYYHDECNTGTTNSASCVNTNWNSIAMNTTLESGGSLYGEGTGNSIDCSDALNNSSCSGYAAAYLTQQCNIDSLYSNDCPLYWEAFDDQQCSLDPQYAPFCQGYTTTESVAYYNVEDDYGYQEEDMWYDEEYDEWLDPNDPCYENRCEGFTDADWYALDVEQFGQEQVDQLYGDTVTFSDDGMVDFDQSDMDQYEDLDLQFDIMDQEIEEYHTFLDTMPHEETFDVLGGYGTEELLEDFEFQVLVLDERIRMEEEQYEEFEQFEDFEDFEEDFEEQFEEYLEEERYAEEDFEEEFYPEEEIFEEEFVEEIFEDIQEMREEMIEEERLVELEESFEAEETLAEEIPATIAFAEPAKKSDKATRRANIRKLVAGTIAAATGSTDYSGSTAGASASQTGTSASSGGSGSGGNMSISSSPSMSDQFASSSQQTQQVLSMSPSTATSGSSGGGGMSTTSSSSDSSTSISITPMPGMGGGASGAMVDVQVSNLSGEIDTAMSGAMTASEADSIADQIVAANIEAQQEEGESTQEETGKYGDESTLVAYLGYVPGFNAYTSAQLPTQTSWYEPTALDGGVIGDNVVAFYELAGTNMRNMTAMVNSQPNLLGE
jgi:hypothetical protein